MREEIIAVLPDLFEKNDVELVNSFKQIYMEAGQPFGQ